MDIKELLHKRRIEKSLTMADVAKAVGVSEATVSRWESGEIADMRRSKIVALAKVLDISPSHLMGWEEESNGIDLYSIKNIEPMPNMVKVPLIGTIACGEPILADENIESILTVPEKYKGTFALRCKGDSMITARILDGDLVFVRPQPTVENGEIAAVLIDNEATLKRVFLSKNRLELRAENPTFKPLYYADEQLNSVKILGKAVGFLSRVI